MSSLLIICYIWGRYYANRLDYARTVQALLEDSDDSDEDLNLNSNGALTSSDSNAVTGNNQRA